MPFFTKIVSQVTARCLINRNFCLISIPISESIAAKERRRSWERRRVFSTNHAQCWGTLLSTLTETGCVLLFVRVGSVSRGILRAPPGFAALRIRVRTHTRESCCSRAALEALPAKGASRAGETREQPRQPRPAGGPCRPLSPGPSGPCCPLDARGEARACARPRPRRPGRLVPASPGARAVLTCPCGRGAAQLGGVRLTLA